MTKTAVTREMIVGKIREVIAKQLGLTNPCIHESDSISELGIPSSLDLITRVIKELGLKLSDEKIAELADDCNLQIWALVQAIEEAIAA